MDPGGEFWGTGFLGAATQGAPINTLTYDSAGNPLPLDTSTLTANGPSDIPSDIPSGTPSDFDNAYAGGGNFAAGLPDFMGPAEEFRTPQQTWDAFMSTREPFWQSRAPLKDLGARLRGRYLLSAPRMAEYGTPVSFSDYLSGYPAGMATGADPSYYAQNPAELRARAQSAANAASMDPGAYMMQFDRGEIGTTERDLWNRAAWRTAQFNPLDNPDAMQNQLRVANMLALQRGQGQNPITGMMAAAIRAAMARVQQQRLNQGAAQGSFLNWYMGQTQPGT